MLSPTETLRIEHSICSSFSRLVRFPHFGEWNRSFYINSTFTFYIQVADAFAQIYYGCSRQYILQQVWVWGMQLRDSLRRSIVIQHKARVKYLKQGHLKHMRRLGGNVTLLKHGFLLAPFRILRYQFLVQYIIPIPTGCSYGPRALIPIPAGIRAVSIGKRPSQQSLINDHILLRWDCSNWTSLKARSYLDQ